MATSLSGLTSTGLSTGTSGSSSGSFTGLGQGINVNAFVQAAEAGAQADIANVQNQQTTVAGQTSALGTITSNLSALQSAVGALNDPLGVLASQTATSSDPSAVTATATLGATAGAHTIVVSNLATTSSYYTDAVASSSTPLATGDTIAISVGGHAAASVTVNSTNNTLDEIAAAINGQTSAVHASVVNDANGARLALVSATSGQPGNLNVTGGLHLTGSGNTAIGFHQATQGLNASFTVDGVPISSATNTVSGVINGVTLNLTDTTGTGGASLTVAPDTTSITAAVNSFVSAYNTAITSINSQFQVGPNGSGAQALESDGSLRDAQGQLLAAVSFAVQGDGGPVSLASLGINTNDDGTLTVNSGALASALSSNFSGVQSFFQTATTGFASNLNATLNNLVGGSGELTLDAQGYSATSNDLAQQLSDLQAALAVQTTNLTAVYAQVNTTLEELPLLQAQLGQQIATIA